MKPAQFLYGGFSCRETLEATIDIFREEGFKSQDLEILVGTPTQTTTDTLLANGWLAGVPTTPTKLARPSWIALLSWPLKRTKYPILTYLHSGGLVLRVTTWSKEMSTIAEEILEDAGADRIGHRDTIPKAGAPCFLDTPDFRRESRETC